MHGTIRAQAAGDPSTTPYIEVDHVYLGYAGETRSQPVIARRDLNFTIDGGEFVALVGPSGCGKTTFLEVAGRPCRGGRREPVHWRQAGHRPWP